MASWFCLVVYRKREGYSDFLLLCFDYLIFYYLWDSKISISFQADF